MKTLLLLLAICAAARAEDGLALKLDLSLSLNAAAHLHATPPRSTERGGRIDLALTHDGPSLSLRAEGRLRWNEAYRGGAYSLEAKNAYGVSADWRELYVSTKLAQWTLAAGLQQVVWGKADNLRITDIVNPLDLRDFVLPDLNDYRKAVMMLRLNRTIEDWNIELLYLPWFTPASFARPGSEYAMPGFDAAAPEGVKLLPEKRPARNFGNGEFGAQVARKFGAFDTNWFAFYTRDDYPVFRRIAEIDAQGKPTPALQAEYRRQLMLGLALARPVGNSAVLRTEWAYVPNFTYMTSDASGDGLTASPTLTWLAGLDYMWRDWMFSVQATDRYIRNWTADFQVKRHALLYSLSATGATMSGRLESRFAFTRYADSADGGWLQLKTTWKPDDRWAYTLGADFFSGAPLGFFGQFREKDRLYIEAKYRF